MKLTADLTRKVLQYDEETGDLWWLPRDRSMFSSDKGFKIWTTKFCGKKAGYVSQFKKNYKAISIFMPDKKQYLAHRIIWLYMTGEFPKNQIDHLDHNPLNNAWVNLREADNHVNHTNRPRQSNNKSGMTGVHWVKTRRKWKAAIKVKGDLIILGVFDKIEDAIKARVKANKVYGFSENHGKDLEGREYLCDNRYM